MAQRKANSDYIDIAGILRDYLSKWYLFAISVIVCVGIAFVLTQGYQRPMAVMANILITQEDDSLLAGAAGLGSMGSLFGSSAYVEDEIFIISSHSLYREVAKDLQLNKTHIVKSGFMKSYLAYPDFPVDVTSAPGVPDTLSVSLSFKVKVNEKGVASITVKGPKKVTYAKVKDVKLPYEVKTP